METIVIIKGDARVDQTVGDWRRRRPKYRLIRDLKPPAKPRFALEKPWTETSEADVWQYLDRPLPAGTVIETTCWPHESLFAINEAARRVLEFYRSSVKSRLTRTPWMDGELRLSTGLEGPGVPFVRPPAPAIPRVA